jgi:hypothetical protein
MIGGGSLKGGKQRQQLIKRLHVMAGREIRLIRLNDRDVAVPWKELRGFFMEMELHRMFRDCHGTEQIKRLEFWCPGRSICPLL